MNRVKQALLVLCTLALVILGAAMPWLSAWMQDRRTGGLQEEFDLNAVSLTLRKDAGAADTLRLMAEAYSALTWEGETVFHWEDIREAAYDVTVQLAAAGLADEKQTLSSSFGGGVVAPQLALSEDGSLSAIIWYVMWGKSSAYYLAMDDTTGKMVGGLLPRSGKLSLPEFNAEIQNWLGFCEDYYGVSVADMGWIGGNPVVDGELIGGSTFVMTLQPEEGDSLELRLVFHERTVEFNALKAETDADSMAKG